MLHKDKIIIYQVMVRLFGNTKSAQIPFGTIEENGIGKFNDLNDKALQEIKNLGNTHLYLTGILEHATLTDYTFFNIKKDHADVVKGRAGSPYAIKDYYDVDPDLAVEVPQRMQEFEALVKRVHDNELKVIIDFVPNHVARQYYSDAKPAGVKDFGEQDDISKAFDPQNNYYYIPDEKFKAPHDYKPLGKDLSGDYEEFPAKVSGNDIFTSQPSIFDWFETVKLNYGVDIKNGQNHFSPTPDTWKKMLEILLFWCSKDIDGFRCDMAGMVPVEFWNWLIPQIKEKYPEVIFIAEIYEMDKYRQYISEAKFDFLYDKVGLYDSLRKVIQQGIGLEEVKQAFLKFQDIDHHLLRFLENHDEQRIASTYFAEDPFKALPAMVVTATIGKGPVMSYFGQELGEPAAGAAGFSSDDGRTTIFDYWSVPEHQKWMNKGNFDGAKLSSQQLQLREFYQILLNLTKESKAIAQGTFFDMDTDNIFIKNNIFSYLRFSGDERLLIICNFSEVDSKVELDLPIESFHKMGIDPEGSYLYIDLLDSGTKIISEGRKINLNIRSLGTFILSLNPIH